MDKQGSIKIDTVPLPEKPISIEIPAQFLKEFEDEVRVVLRHPWVIGIPAPHMFLQRILKDTQSFKEITEKFDIMFVPK